MTASHLRQIASVAGLLALWQLLVQTGRLSELFLPAPLSVLASMWAMTRSGELPWAVLALICARGAGWAWVLLGVAIVMRYAVALVVGRTVLQDRQVTKWLALVPLRDFAAALVWLIGFWGHGVTWRGDWFTLRDGKLVGIRPSSLHLPAGEASSSKRPSE